MADINPDMDRIEHEVARDLAAKEEHRVEGIELLRYLVRWGRTVDFERRLKAWEENDHAELAR